MSGSAEVPDILGGISQALGVNRLWETEEQADSEKRKADQAEESRDDESRRIRPGKARDEADGVESVSTQKENEGQEGPDIHGVPKRRAPKKQRGHRYEWPIPASLTDIQAKRRYDSEPIRLGKPSQEEEAEPSKSVWTGSLIPFLRDQRSTLVDSPLPTGPAAVSHERDNPFDHPRPLSSSTQRRFDRSKSPRPQFTLPSERRRDSQESGHARARSRWTAATHSLRFPLRRRKTELHQITDTHGRELITQLVAGAPAATLVGMHMVPDERSHCRIPVIIDLLKVPRFIRLKQITNDWLISLIPNH